MTFSHNKGKYTLKIGVGVTPAGLIAWLSKIFGGRTSDKKKNVMSSEILDQWTIPRFVDRRLSKAREQTTVSL